jgi:DNA (cytosine-5)-methyltransferase 1
MRNGRLYPPLTQGVATTGSESSSSPGLLLFKTPTAQLGINGGSQHPSKRRGGGHGPTLADEVEHLLPTPQAHDRHGARSAEQLDEARKHTRAGFRNLNETVANELAPLLPTPAARDYKSGESNLLERNARPLNEVAVAHLRPSGRDLLPTPTASLGTVEATAPWKDGVIWWKQSRAARNVAAIAESRFSQDVVDYGRYARAVLRWAQTIDRLPPPPLEMSPRGTLVLSPPFVEWMMGLEPGWVTGLGLSRGAQLKLLGNGVVPQQVVLGLSILLPRVPVLWKQ